MSPQPNTSPAPEVIGDYTVHPVASMFPLLEGKDYEELKQSIKEHGQIEPIIIDEWKEDCLLLDGRNRLRACLELKIDPWIIESPFKKQAKVPPAEFILAQNLFRRHLTDDQRMMIAAAILHRKEREEAEARQREAGKHGSKGGRGKKAAKTHAANSTQGFREPTASEKIAAAAKGTDYQARQALAVIEAAPELAEPVKQGKMALKDAAAEAHTRKAEKTGAKVPPPPKPAAPPDVTSGRLAELEAIIETGTQTFVEVGNALLEIRKRRLYREQGYKTFEDYCWDGGTEWDDIIEVVRMLHDTFKRYTSGYSKAGSE